MEFNSLDAQRDACEAYVASQRQEGWLLVPDHYDDGGISGATLERPALKRLMTGEASQTSTMTVHVPISLRKRGCRKLIVTEGGHLVAAPTRPQIDSALLRALVQAFRWKALLDANKFATSSELAAAEKMNTSYVTHVLKLTLLAPDLVEAILDGKQPRELQLQPYMRAVSADWSEQRSAVA